MCAFATMANARQRTFTMTPFQQVALHTELWEFWREAGALHCGQVCCRRDFERKLVEPKLLAAAGVAYRLQAGQVVTHLLCGTASHFFVILHLAGLFSAGTGPGPHLEYAI